jgi:hypothetical protein
MVVASRKDNGKSARRNLKIYGTAIVDDKGIIESHQVFFL